MSDLNFNMTTESIRKDIFSLADEKYRQFHSKLVPGEDTIIGVRVPVLRKYAGELYSSWKSAGAALEPASGFAEGLIELIGDEYYEEIMLQGMIIGMQKVQPQNRKNSHKKSAVALNTEQRAISIEKLYYQIEAFVPKINNWAVCDVFCAGLKQVRKYPKETYDFLQKFIYSDKEYDIRFGIVMLLDYYVQADYLERIFEICDKVSKTEKDREAGENYNGYYVKMAVAWLISICFVKYCDETRAYMSSCSLDDWTYNKAIQKARESRRITEVQKEELQGMKR